MLIDWFTVIAQIANFLILVWLMKRYLYRPILNAIDVRENRIAAQLKDAEAKKSDATKEHDLFQQKNQAFDASRDTMIKTAQQSAESERQKLIESARKDADVIRTKRDAALQNEFAILERELATAIQKEAFSIARHTLTNLADVNIETQISQVFIQRLESLESQSKDALVTAFKSALPDVPHPVQVRSAFTLSASDQATIRQALKLIVGIDLAVKFEVVADLVCGIELTANGQKIAWSIDDYLDSLNSHINQILTPTVGQVT